MIFYDVEHLYTTGTKKGDAKKLNRVFSDNQSSLGFANLF